jgi:hypothetical protein
MNRKLFNYFLYFALFGIAIGFFGILYEGLVYGPKMLGDSKTRMHFWKDFYSVISPLFYYIPLNPLATITLVILFFSTSRQEPELRNKFAARGPIADRLVHAHFLYRKSDRSENGI